MSSRPTFRAMMWRWRRLITAALLALCLAIVVSAIVSSGRVTSQIMVAASDMPAGHVISASDVAWVAAPTGTIPRDLVPEDVAGHRLSIGVPAGTPVTESMFVGPTLADSAPAGTVIVPVLLSTPKELTPVGSSVDLWGSDEAGEAFQAATAATIMAFSDVAASRFGTDTTELTYAFVAVSSDDAILVLSISATTPLIAVLHG